MQAALDIFAFMNDVLCKDSLADAADTKKLKNKENFISLKLTRRDEQFFFCSCKNVVMRVKKDYIEVAMLFFFYSFAAVVLPFFALRKIIQFLS